MTRATIPGLHDVMQRTGMARSPLYLRMSLGPCPTQVSLGERSAGCLDAEVDRSITALVEKSRGTQAA